MAARARRFSAASHRPHLRDATNDLRSVLDVEFAPFINYNPTQMSSPVKETRPASMGVAGRRSTRLSIAIPIAISGKDAAGNSFKENSRTAVINKQGAKILTTHQLALGAEVVIENRALGLSGKAIVVWIGDRVSTKEAVEMGVQLLESANIWGIEFPPEDWQEGPPIGPGGVKLEAAGATSIPVRPPEVAHPLKTDGRPREHTPEPGSPRPAPVTTPPREGGVPRASQPGELRATTSTPGMATTDQLTIAREVAVAKFSQQAQAAADEQVKLFVNRLAKLTNQIGIQMQTSLHNSATEIEAKMVRSLDEQIGSLLDRLQATRTEVDGQLARLQELQQSSQSEVEKTQRNIQEAGWQALQAATEQLSETLQRGMEDLTRPFLEDTRKRIQADAASVLGKLNQESRARVAELLDTYSAKTLPEMQARQAEALKQIKQQIGEAAQFAATNSIDALHKQSDDLLNAVRSEIQSAVLASREKSIQEVTERLRKTAQDLATPAADEFRRQVDDGRQTLKEELRTTGKTLAEEGKKELAALTNETVSALNKSVNSGLAEFQSEIQKALHEFQEKNAKELERHQAKVEHAHSQLDKALVHFEEKGARELESHFQKSAEKHREALLKQLQQDVDETAERAVAQIHAKIDLSVKEASETVNKNVASAAVFLGAIEEKARVDLEGHARKYEERAKSSVETGEKRLAELSAVARETLAKEMELLVKDRQSQGAEGAGKFELQNLDEVPARLRSATEKLIEESTALLTKQAEEIILSVSEKLNQQKETAVNEASEALRTKLADMFATVLQPGAPKPRK